MSLSGNRSGSSIFSKFSKFRLSPTVVFFTIILTALLAFELFNYSTTDYALSDLLGGLEFAGLRWSTILAIAFCGIDFAGIARLFTPEQGAAEPKEVWYLLGAWLLAATMNAALTWWGVSMAIANHAVKSSAVIDANTLTKVVPVFVAVMVWVIRVLIIGSLSQAGDRMLNRQRSTGSGGGLARPRPLGQTIAPQPVGMRSANLSPRPAGPRPSISAAPDLGPNARPEPTYHSVSASARPLPRPVNSGESPHHM